MQLDELGERRAADAPGSPRSPSRRRRWQSTSACGAEPWRRPSVTPEYAGWTSEPWPSTRSSSPPRRRPSTTSRSAAPAMKSATTASTAMPQPAIAIPVCPVGTNTDAMPARARRAVELERDGHLPDRAVRADGEHDRRVDLEVRAGRAVEVRRAGGAGRAARRRARRPAAAARGRRRASGAGRSRATARCSMQSASSSRHAGGNRAALRRDADERDLRARRPSAASTSATIGTPPSRLARALESRIATTSSRR